MRALSVARAICMELKQEKDRKSLNVKVLVKNGYIADYPTLFNFSDPWACSSCCLKEYGQPLVNTVKTLKAEVASLKKQVNSKSCPPQVLSVCNYDVKSRYYHLTSFIISASSAVQFP